MQEPKPDIVPGAQGRVKDRAKDRRLARNRPEGSTGQGAVKDKSRDRRLSVNRPEGSTGQGKCIRDDDRRLLRNRKREESFLGMMRANSV